MKSANATLPLGVDIGHARVRVALTERNGVAEPRLIGVATRNHTGHLAAALIEAIGDLKTRERRCIVALGPPDACLQTVTLPRMPRWERLRAARFEAHQYIDYPVDEAALSLIPPGNAPGWTLGIARRSALSRAMHTVRSAGLRPIAVDDIGLALRRAHPRAQCVIDIGKEATRLILLDRPIPAITSIPTGGHQLTEAIARSLAMTPEAAEDRKRRIGFGGAAEAERDLFIAAISAAIIESRAPRGNSVQHIVLSGNGARVPGLDAAIAVATGANVCLATIAASASDTLPADVLRMAGADWSLAYGLALWNYAA